MIYNHQLHNFKDFIKEWNTETEYVLFGASKECVQFIRSMDSLLGVNTLKIKYIVDHDVKDTAVIDNLNGVSPFYRESRDFKSERTNLKLVHIDDFKGDGAHHRGLSAIRNGDWRWNFDALTFAKRLLGVIACLGFDTVNFAQG